MNSWNHRLKIASAPIVMGKHIYSLIIMVFWVYVIDNIVNYNNSKRNTGVKEEENKIYM